MNLFPEILRHYRGDDGLTALRDLNLIHLQGYGKFIFKQPELQDFYLHFIETGRVNSALCELRVGNENSFLMRRYVEPKL
jgi:hypothetical protein